MDSPGPVSHASRALLNLDLANAAACDLAALLRDEHPGVNERVSTLNRDLRVSLKQAEVHALLEVAAQLDAIRRGIRTHVEWKAPA